MMSLPSVIKMYHPVVLRADISRPSSRNVMQPFIGVFPVCSSRRCIDGEKPVVTDSRALELEAFLTLLKILPPTGRTRRHAAAHTHRHATAAPAAGDKIPTVVGH